MTTTTTVPHGSGLFLPSAVQQLLQRLISRRYARPREVTRAGWLEQLAAWAERQPPHHRLGSYMSIR